MPPNALPGVMPPPAAPAEDPNEMEAPAMPGEICVPLAALAQPDEQEQMTPPAEGDKGSANLDYTVSRVAGENAYIKVDALNGEPIEDPNEDKQDGGNDEASEEAGIRQSLGGADQGDAYQ